MKDFNKVPLGMSKHFNIDTKHDEGTVKATTGLDVRLMSPLAKPDLTIRVSHMISSGSNISSPVHITTSAPET